MLNTELHDLIREKCYENGVSPEDLGKLLKSVDEGKDQVIDTLFEILGRELA